MKFFEELMESSAKVADKVAKVTGEYIDKGKEKINEFSLENELGKAQKQLGALVYALHKSGESNDELVKQYIEDIAKIEAQLEEVRKEAEEAEVEVVNFCSNCGAQTGIEDAFCKNCGNNLK
ncbi:MAG: hypothetical protein IKA10_07080 [Oscillospiraceae bacterium]|nr:hypothetical protein [Oscillospiraceae bacterium]